MSMFRVLPPTVTITDPGEVPAALEYLSRAKILAVDTETTGLSRPRDRAIILAISDGKERYAIWPQCMPYFADLIENPEVKLIMHNANFDSWMLLNSGINVNRHSLRGHYRIYDTMVMHALVNDQVAHDLKSLTKEYLGIDMVPFSKVFDLRSNRKKSLTDLLLAKENEAVVANYAGLDAYATYHLFLALRSCLRELPIAGLGGSLWDYYTQYELKFTKVLWELERNGIGIDVDQLVAMGPPLEEEMLSVQKWFGREMQRLYVNPSSNQQMGALFFGTLGREPVSYTDGGAPQLNQAVLNKWAREGCEYAQKLLRYREIDKQLGTYIRNLLCRVHLDQRIHATFNQTGARTGRLSSSDPNLQNQPPFVREAYVPAPGHRLLAADYAQLEMRILAHMSGDPSLCGAIIEGQDVHTSTAATMFRVPYEDVYQAREKSDAGEPITAGEKILLGHRKAAKAINFGLMYGQGSGKLASTLDCSIEDARGLIKQYFRTFPKVTDYFNSAIASAKNRGFCTTILGRRRQVPGLNSNLDSDVSAGERQVKNSPIQGTAAEIAKLAMIRLYEDKDICSSGARMLIQVHDEIVFEVPKELEHDKEFNGRIETLMAHPFADDLRVPLETTSKYGDNWLECK